MHPQAVFVDASGNEEEYFLPAARAQASEEGIPSLIELPEGAQKRLGWITKLDSASLAGEKTTARSLFHKLTMANIDEQKPGTKSMSRS